MNGRGDEIVSLPFETEVPALVHRAPGAGSKALVLALHGQGMRPEGFRRQWQPLLDLDAHVVFPRGLYPVEIRGAPGPAPRKIGYSWYVYDGNQERFAAELERGVGHLERLLDRLVSLLDVDVDRIALIGFSQGGYLGYAASMRLAGRLAAYVGCAARLKDEVLAREIASPPRRFPILHVHGEGDAAVTIEAARSTVAALERHGWPVTLELHPGGHLVGSAEVERIRDWLAATLQISVVADRARASRAGQ